ncbi:hypothetical protein HY478_00350 [Candidatus Uhrbacteria bacterium]|nr:hypothetical protein [Candidatus Uhrbacteria bacterium]
MLFMATGPPTLATAADDGNEAAVASMNVTIDAATTGTIDEASCAERAPTDVGASVLNLPLEVVPAFADSPSDNANFVGGGELTMDITANSTEDAYATNFAARHSPFLQSRRCIVTARIPAAA